MKLFNRVLQSLALPSIVIFAASNLLYSNIASAELNVCNSAVPRPVQPPSSTATPRPLTPLVVRVLTDVGTCIDANKRICDNGPISMALTAAAQFNAAGPSAARRGARDTHLAEQGNARSRGTTNAEAALTCRTAAEDCVGAISTLNTWLQYAAADTLPTFTEIEAAISANRAKCVALDAKTAAYNAEVGTAQAAFDVASQGIQATDGIVGQTGGFISRHKGVLGLAAGGVAGYMLGSSMGDNKEQKEIDKLKKELADKSVTGGKDSSNDDCSKPGVITKQECATHFASLCYNNSSAASCAEFNTAYCNGGAASTVSNPINGSGSFYCSMVGIKAACANSSDATMTCTWYRQLSQACLTNLAQIQSATCMPQYAGNTYSQGCTAMPSQKLCQSPFSTVLSNSAQVAAQGTVRTGSSSASGAGDVSAQSAIGSASAGVNVGSSGSLPISRGVASVDVSPMGANLFSIQDGALTGVNLVGSGQ